MSLPPSLVGENVEDAESRFSEADREPRDRCRFLLDQRKTTAKKVFYVCLFPGLCFQSNPQSEFCCVSHGFLLKLHLECVYLDVLAETKIPFLIDSECLHLQREGGGSLEVFSWLPFWQQRAGFFRKPDVHALSVTPGNRR